MSVVKTPFLPSVLPVLAALACLTAAVYPAGAQVAPQHERLRNFDAREQGTVATQPLGEQREAAANLRKRLPGVEVGYHPLTGAPKHIAVRGGFLTGAGGQGGGLAASAVPVGGQHGVVRGFIAEHRDLFGHGPSALDAAAVKRDYVAAHNGLQTTVWEQQVAGVPVFEALLMAHVTKRGELVSVSSGFVPAAVNASPDLAAVLARGIGPAAALAQAAGNLGVTMGAADAVAAGAAEGATRKQRFTAPQLSGDAWAQLVWLPLGRGELRLCWDVLLTERAHGEMFRVLVSVADGTVLVRRGLTEHISPATYNVYTSDSPSPFSPGHQTPLTTQPPLVPRQLVILDAFNTNASPNGWINDGDNETRGNNVDAHLDRNDDNQPDLPRPQGAPNRVFDFPLDLTQPPATYGDAAVVQLFYLNNWVHDRLYELGFTEAAGNFQNVNFGRGGLGNDAVQADAQDGAGLNPPNVNNANMATPPDGFAPRMQMYVFDGPNPDRDGDLDADVVVHEYVHGLSNRRVGGGVGISQLQSAGMGEGWSDFYALSLLSEPGDDPDLAYAPGGYLTLNLFGLQQNYYFGIRRYPYSTDLTKNPLTFKDIDPAQASAHAGVPMSPWLVGIPGDEVHNQGEVWCIALWEARANLIRKYGHVVGNELMLQLVTDGMALSPANPNFLEARDAILMADLVNNGGVNIPELGAGFAKRGMGASATSPRSSTTAGVREAFDSVGVSLTGFTAKDSPGGNNNGWIDPGETLRETVALQNTGFVPLTNATATLSTITPGVTVLQGTVNLGAIPAGATVSNAVPLIYRVERDIACETMIDFSLAVAANGTNFTFNFQHLVGQIIITSVSTNVIESLNVPVVIPDLGTANSLNTLALGGTNLIDDIDVSLRVDHTFVGDLQVDLVHPDGTVVTLSQNNGSFVNPGNFGTGACDTGVRTTFDDQAATPIGAGAPPYAGSFRPDNALSAFHGKTANGDWNLRIQDQAFLDSGTNLCWNIRVVTHEQIIVCTPFFGQPTLSAAGASVSDESFAPANGVIEVGERVTVSFAIQNNGGGDAFDINALLLPNGGVINPTGTQDYGVIPPNGGIVERPFTFTAGGTNGGTITAILLLREGTNVLGTLNYAFTLPLNRTFTDPAAILINFAGAGTPYPATLQVSNVSGQVARARVTLNKFTHSFPDDVDILLVSPTGRKVMLASDVGGGHTVTNLIFTFDDTAPSSLPNSSVLQGGLFRPTDFEPGDVLAGPAPAGPYETSLAAFNEDSPNGVWSLYVFDDATGDGGNISGGWSLELFTVTPINPPGDLRLTLGTPATNAVTGVPITYTLGVTNLGPSIANAVTVVNPLPAGATMAGATLSQGTWTNVGGQVTFRFGSLPIAGQATATLTLTPSLVGLLTNRATANAGRTEFTPADNAALVVTPVGAPTPVLQAAGTQLLSESFNPPNGALEPGETVTVSLALRNVGTRDATNLVATLEAGAGVLNPSGPQNYGALAAGGGTLARDFTFTAAAFTNGQIIATLSLVDNGQPVGSVPFLFSLGGAGEFSSSAPIVIPFIGAATPYPATIAVSNLQGVVSRVTVTLSNLNHGFADDIDALLVGPAGERVVLLSDAGGGHAVGGVTLVLADEAAAALPDALPLSSGAFQPSNYTGQNEAQDVWPAPAPAGPYAPALAEFLGTDPNGTWSLFITDDTGGDGGQVAGGWSLRIETVAPLNDSADLTLTGRATTNEIVAGELLTFTLILSNKGPDTATSVLLSNAVPEGSRLVSAFQSQGSLLNADGELFAQLGAVNSGAAATLTIVVVPFRSGLLTNHAAGSSGQTDYALANNRSTLFVNVLPAPQPVLGPVTGVTTNDAFEFAITGQPNLFYVIEASTNLVDWVPISTNLPAGGKITIIDPDAATIPERFYRARQSP